MKKIFGILILCVFFIITFPFYFNFLWGVFDFEPRRGNPLNPSPIDLIPFMGGIVFVPIILILYFFIRKLKISFLLTLFLFIFLIPIDLLVFFPHIPRIKHNAKGYKACRELIKQFPDRKKIYYLSKDNQGDNLGNYLEFEKTNGKPDDEYEDTTYDGVRYVSVRYIGKTESLYREYCQMYIINNVIVSAMNMVEMQ